MGKQSLPARESWLKMRMKESALFIRWGMFPAAPWTEAHGHFQLLHVVEARVSALLPRWMLQEGHISIWYGVADTTHVCWRQAG